MSTEPKQTKTITIPANTKQEDPIVLQEKNMMVVLQEGACATIYEHNQVQDLTFHLHAQSKLKFFTTITQAGSKMISVFLHGKNACANINCTYFLSGDQKFFLQIKQEHMCTNAESSCVLRGVLAGRAKISINGMIFVDRAAEETKATQQNKTILLSAGAQVKSSPELAVLNKNVRCSHGSAAGQFDENMLFYLCSRGMTKKIAKRCLLESFLAMPLAGLEDEKREMFLKPVNKKLQELV